MARQGPTDQVGLSVVLCTCNGERWLPALLRSIAGQTHPPDELVVHDDASTDRTTELVEEFARTVSFPVHLRVHDARMGSTANFASAISSSRGRVVALADQDDVWYPTKLALLMHEFELDSTISMVFSDADLIGEDGTRIGPRLWDTRLVGRTLRRHAVVPEELLARRALTTGCTMAIRRRVIEAALPFPDLMDDRRAIMRHDRWLSLVAAAVGTVRAVPEPLLGFRVHPQQETGVLVGPQLSGALRRAMFQVGRNPATATAHEVRASQLMAAASRADLVGDFKEAATLRSVADHQAARAQVGQPGHGPLTVLRAAAHGDYRGDPLASAAVAADLIRAVTVQAKATGAGRHTDPSAPGSTTATTTQGPRRDERPADQRPHGQRLLGDGRSGTGRSRPGELAARAPAPPALLLDAIGRRPGHLAARGD
ncbi:glycosyltransferase family 2 protein [Aquihabitans daechungensis]|uniref:glycosyltransferase family 2 protein n=1 Tax=Aquihabitans daechungensis TaxID=1052257 RepID=UPI003BA37C9A